MSLLDKYIKRATQGPLRRLSTDIIEKTTSAVETRLENTVSSVFTKALGKTNLSSKVINELSARFGDAVQRELSDKYFQTFSTGVQRLITGSIYDNMLPSNLVDITSAEASDAVDRQLYDSRLSVKGSKEVLQFPNQLGPYYMAMNFRSYKRTAPQLRAETEFKNSVVLPLPKNITEHFHVGVSQTSLGAVGATTDFFQTAGQSNDPAGYMASQFGALGYTLSTQLFSSVFSKAGAGTLDVLGQFVKAIPNPHMAAIFNGVDMRQFRFTWTFAPRNPEESMELKKIINVLKQNALPAFSSTGTSVLQYPNLCFVDMYPWAAAPGNELIKFKPALLTDVSINYAPNGIPSFFAGTNLPTFVQIDLSFIETEYFTADDFGRAADTEGDGADRIQTFMNYFGNTAIGKSVMSMIEPTMKDTMGPVQVGIDAVNDKDKPK